MRGARLEGLKETAGPQPSPAQPSPRRRQAQALARVERRRPRQEARAKGLWQNFVRSMAHEANAAGMAGRGPGMEGVGFVTVGPTLVGLYLLHTGDHIHPGLYRPNNTRNEEPTVKASASSPYSLPSTSWLPAVAHISCHARQCGKQGPCVGALHRLRPRRSTKRYQCNFSAALGADAGTATHRPSQPLISHGRSPNGTFFSKRTIPNTVISPGSFFHVFCALMLTFCTLSTV